MGRAKHKRTSRDGSRFLALPHTVMDSPAFLALSASAIRLLLDIARQLDGRNNGRLVACMSALKYRGWKSNDTLMSARRELEAAGLLFETRKGARPNKAAWFAVTWLELEWVPEMECSQATYPRGRYAGTVADAVRLEQERAQTVRKELKARALQRKAAP